MKDTTLLAFFKLCEVDEFARKLFYIEVPNFYTWNSTQRKWLPR